MKIPEPIIEPMTSVVASRRPRPFTRLVAVELLMRVYCTLPISYALKDGRGGAIGGKQISDNGDRISAGVEHRSRIASGDAADRRQRLRRQMAPGAQAVDSHDRVGIELRLRGEHRAQGEVGRRVIAGCGELFGVLGGGAEE